MVENGYLRNIVLGLIDKLNKAFLVLKLFGGIHILRHLHGGEGGFAK